MAELEESKDFIKNLLTTGIIGKDWPKKTYLIVVVKDSSGKVIWKKKYQTLPNHGGVLPNENHTERQMLDDQGFNDQVRAREGPENYPYEQLLAMQGLCKRLDKFF